MNETTVQVTIQAVLRETEQLAKAVEELLLQINTLSKAVESVKNVTELISNSFEQLAEQSIRNVTFAEALINILDKSGVISREAIMEEWERIERELLERESTIFH